MSKPKKVRCDRCSRPRRKYERLYEFRGRNLCRKHLGIALEVDRDIEAYLRLKNVSTGPSDPNG